MEIKLNSIKTYLGCFDGHVDVEFRVAAGGKTYFQVFRENFPTYPQRGGLCDAFYAPEHVANALRKVAFDIKRHADAKSFVGHELNAPSRALFTVRECPECKHVEVKKVSDG
jgi:hypothetical protein